MSRHPCATHSATKRSRVTPGRRIASYSPDRVAAQAARAMSSSGHTGTPRIGSATGDGVPSTATDGSPDT